MTTDTPPVLPRSLLDLIGEYGYARTAGLSEFERLALWDRLIVGIKEYATQHAATTERDLSECRAALELLRQYANDSDDHFYGTLSTSLVRGIVDKALDGKPAARAILAKGEGK